MRCTRRVISLLLALLLGLTACNAGGRPREVHKVDWVMSPAYTAEDIALPVPAGDLQGCCTDGAYLYILADEKVEGEVRTVLSRASLADGTAEILESYEPPQPPEGAYTNKLGPIMGPDGSLWVYEAHTLMYFDFPEDYDPDKEVRTKYYTGQDDFHHLRQLDPETGKQKKLLDLSEAVRTLDIEDLSDVSGFAVDGRGNAYFAGSGGVAVIDSKGKHLVTLKADMPRMLDRNTAGGGLALLPDGTVAVLTTTPDGREVRTIDPDAKDWGEARYALPMGVDLIYDGTGGFLFFYTQGGELYAWEPENGEPRRLLSWSGTDLEGSVMCFAPLDGGKLAALALQYTDALTGLDSWYNGQLRLSLLSPSDKDPNNGKAKLVYGTILSDSRLREKVNRFNRESDQYYIEIRSYANMDSDEYYRQVPLDQQPVVMDTAWQRFQAEVAAGNAPDLWDSSLDSYNAYARKGYLEDLWPWIDGDEELGGRDALMTHVLDCLSIDGKLYSAGPAFRIVTWAARSDVVGDRTGWTLEEMLDCLRQLPEGAAIKSDSHSGRELLNSLIRSNGGRFVDWSAGTCRFDSQEFRDILELCRQAEQNDRPETEDDEGNDYTNLRDGRYLAVSVSLGSPGDLLYNDALCSGPEHLWDYGAYLNENHIYSSNIDEDGNWRDKDAVTCDALHFAETVLERGTYLEGLWPLAADTVIGALEGGGYASYVGVPGPAGTNGFFALEGFSVSMSSSCRNKEGAWAFIRRYLLPDGCTLADTYRFPINKEAFDWTFASEWFQDSSGEYILDADGNRIEASHDLLAIPNTVGDPIAMLIYDLSPNEVQLEKFWELYESIGPSQSLDVDLRNIIEEQAQPYFAGDKSLEETVRLIQNRSSLYMNENR